MNLATVVRKARVQIVQTLDDELVMLVADICLPPEARFDHIQSQHGPLGSGRVQCLVVVQAKVALEPDNAEAHAPKDPRKYLVAEVG